MKTILISGKQGAGKTTTSDMLADALRVYGKAISRKRFAQPLYECMEAVHAVLAGYGITRPKKDGPLLQIIGTEYGRNKIDENIWVNCVESLRKQLAPMTDIMIIDDLRFPNEFDIPQGDVLRIRLECDRDERKRRCDKTGTWRVDEHHPSETGLDAYAAAGKFDMLFHTDKGGTPEMIVTEILRKIL